MSATDLTLEDNWHGGGYELAIELGARDDGRLDAAIRACWLHPSLTGCWHRTGRRDFATRVQPELRTQETGHLHGIATIPGVASTVCGCAVIREEESRIDWLDFYLPIGALERIDKRAESLWNSDSDVPPTWRQPIDEYLVETAGRIYEAVEFELGLIGWEVSGAVYRRELGPHPVAERGVTMLVPNRGVGLMRLDATT